MVCESWKEKLDIYLDGELPGEEMRTFDAHVRNCPACSADALSRVLVSTLRPSKGLDIVVRV
jgi:anti-sigma factor RsiW